MEEDNIFNNDIRYGEQYYNMKGANLLNVIIDDFNQILSPKLQEYGLMTFINEFENDIKVCNEQLFKRYLTFKEKCMKEIMNYGSLDGKLSTDEFDRIYQIMDDYENFPFLPSINDNNTVLYRYSKIDNKLDKSDITELLEIPVIKISFKKILENYVKFIDTNSNVEELFNSITISMEPEVKNNILEDFTVVFIPIVYHIRSEKYNKISINNYLNQSEGSGGVIAGMFEYINSDYEFRRTNDFYERYEIGGTNLNLSYNEKENMGFTCNRCKDIIIVGTNIKDMDPFTKGSEYESTRLNLDQPAGILDPSIFTPKYDKNGNIQHFEYLKINDINYKTELSYEKEKLISFRAGYHHTYEGLKDLNVDTLNSMIYRFGSIEGSTIEEKIDSLWSKIMPKASEINFVGNTQFYGFKIVIHPNMLIFPLNERNIFNNPNFDNLSKNEVLKYNIDNIELLDEYYRHYTNNLRVFMYLKINNKFEEIIIKYVKYTKLFYNYYTYLNTFYNAGLNQEAINQMQ